MNTVTIRLATIGSDANERMCGMAMSMGDSNDTLSIEENWFIPKMKRQSATINGLMKIFEMLYKYTVFYQDENEEVRVDIIVNYPEIVNIMNTGMKSPLYSIWFKKDEVYTMIEKEISTLKGMNVNVRLFSGSDKEMIRRATKAKVNGVKQIALEGRLNEHYNWAE